MFQNFLSNSEISYKNFNCSLSDFLSLQQKENLRDKNVYMYIFR